MIWTRALNDKVTVKASRIYCEEFIEDLKKSFEASLEGETVSLEEFEEKFLKKP